MDNLTNILLNTEYINCNIGLDWIGLDWIDMVTYKTMGLCN